jgi:hypothetical protein
MPWTTVGVGFTCLALGLFAGQRLMLARQRLRAIRDTLDHARNAASLVALFNQTVARRTDCTRAGLTNHVKVFNAIQFTVVWNWDLTTLLRQLGQTAGPWTLEKGWQRKLLARTLALTIYESLIKLKEFFDKDRNRRWSLRRALRALKVEEGLAPALDAVHAQIEQVLISHGPLLEGIRTNIIGHRDQDVAAQLEWMRKTDVDEMERLGWDLLDLTNRVLGALSEVVAALPRPTAA